MTLSNIIKLKTNDGLDVVDFLVEVMHDCYEDFQICHRLQAAKLLTTYGNEDAPDFIDDNPRESRSDRNGRNGRKPQRPTKFDTELARVIKQDTGDGRSIARFLVNAMAGEFKSFKPHHRMSAARELLDRGFGKSARAEKTAHPNPTEGSLSEDTPSPGGEGWGESLPRTRSGGENPALAHPNPANRHSTPANQIIEIPESHKSQFRHPPAAHPEPGTQKTQGQESLTPHSSPLTPRNATATADEIDYWLDTYDTPLYEFMCECEHPDFDPFLAAIDDEYFESFTDCTDPECEVHGDPPDFDPNDYHY